MHLAEVRHPKPCLVYINDGLPFQIYVIECVYELLPEQLVLVAVALV